MSKHYNISPTRTSFFILSAGRTESVQELIQNFSSSYFIADDSPVKIYGSM